MKNLVQVAGVRDEAEAKMLLECGVRYLGFPLRLAFHREDLSEEEASALIRSLPPFGCAVLITYLSEAEGIDALCQRLGVSRVQLHGEVAREELLRLRKLAPHLFVVKSLIVREGNLKELKAQVEELTPYVDAFLTDTFDPTTGAFGATGKTHNWNISRKLVEVSSRPLILAGGLSPDNVYEAIVTVRPAGVDVHTGVEDKSGRKDPGLVRAFIDQAKKGFAALKGEGRSGSG